MVLTQKNSKEIIDELIRRAFEEDIKSGDATTNAIIDADTQAKAIWKSKDEGIVAGLDIAEQVFQKLDADIDWVPTIENGDTVVEGDQLVTMTGKARAILTAERIALNIAQRMSGIASQTQKFVKAIGELNTKILDTRKTVPGFRLLDKFAVRAGGGQNHRMGLYDLVMIKDNHIVAAGGIKKAVQQVRTHVPDLEIEVETNTLQQVDEACIAGVDIIMLDNMSPKLMQQAVSRIGGQAKTEASGNVTLQNVRKVAETGVDFISVGALTHSVHAFDISQTLEELI